MFYGREHGLPEWGSMCTWKKRVFCCCWVECSINVSSSLLIMFYRSYWCSACLFIDWWARSIAVPTVIVVLSISPSSYVSFYFMCFVFFWPKFTGYHFVNLLYHSLSNNFHVSLISFNLEQLLSLLFLSSVAWIFLKSIKHFFL